MARRPIVGFAVALAFLASCGGNEHDVRTEGPSAVPGDPGSGVDDAETPLSATVADVEDVGSQAGASADPEPTVIDVEGLGQGLPSELTSLEGVDIGAVLRRACAAWSFAEYRDHGAINDAVYSFLTNDDGRSVLAEIHDIDTLHDVIIEACDHRDDPEMAWAVLSTRLGLTNGEFSQLVEASCERYWASQPLRSPEAGFDRFILEAVGVADLQSVIDQLCQ